MNKKLFTVIEVALIAGLIIMVLYWGGVFDLIMPAPQPTATLQPTRIPASTEPTLTPSRTIAPTRTAQPTTAPTITPTAPALVQPAGLIAFETTRDGNAEIYTMNADGSGQTNLTRNPADDYDFVWSPDGTRIAFFSTRTGWLEVFVMDADGSSLIQVSHTLGTNAIYHPPLVWSPDNKHILAFRSKVWNTNNAPNPEILDVMESNGSGARTLYENKDQFFGILSWSPDNNHIALSLSSPDSSCRIQVAEFGVEPFKFQPIASTCEIFTWSPDGNQIAFALDDSIYIYALDGTQVHHIQDTPNPCGCGIFNWSPDGQHFLYLSSNGMVGIVSLDGVRRLILPIRIYNDNGWPDWSPDGQWVTFLDMKQLDVSIVNIYDRSQTILLTNTNNNYAPQWQP